MRTTHAFTLSIVVFCAACSSASVQRAGEGALTGAGTGAVSSGVQGSQEDARNKQREAAEAQRREVEALNKLRAEVGPNTFSGLEALTDGKHQVALAYARTAMDSDNSRYAMAGQWLEALTYQDHGDLQAASDPLPALVEIDPYVDNLAEAAEVLDGLATELQKIRAAYT